MLKSTLITGLVLALMMLHIQPEAAVLDGTQVRQVASSTLG